jgi:site-specific recombinase XerD
MTGKHALMAKMLYGGGLRLLECIRLRLQDMDLGQELIQKISGYRAGDRLAMGVPGA